MLSAFFKQIIYELGIGVPGTPAKPLSKMVIMGCVMAVLQ